LKNSNTSAYFENETKANMNVIQSLADTKAAFEKLSYLYFPKYTRITFRNCPAVETKIS